MILGGAVKIHWTRPNPVQEYLSFITLLSSVMLNDVAQDILTLEMNKQRKTK